MFSLPSRWSRSASFLIPVGGLLLGATSLLTAQTLPPAPGAAPHCVPDPHTLCMDQQRFAVTAAFQLTPSGPSSDANAVSLTDQTGYFWFFDATNVEVVVKVLNACGPPYNAYWVFASGLTNVGVTILVKDLATNMVQTYSNDVGTPFPPIQDTSAFQTCF
ncbi:MAG: hypothetical protein ACHQ16_07575 [Candidatus Lutacidiplasmatales archaeon]